MYRFSLSVDIAATPARVWRALCDPGEVVRWDTSIEGAVDAPDDYPQAGQRVRWRLRSRFFRLLYDRPVEVIPERRLRSLLALGPFRYDETYTIEETEAGCRLSAQLSAWTAIPVLGPLIDHLYVEANARNVVLTSLAGIKTLCEGQDVC